jgi:hypothetical protein
MTAEDFDAFRVCSIGSSFGTPRSAAVCTTTTGTTQHPLVAIGHHGAKRGYSAFPAPKNKCWHGPTIPLLTLSPVASSPSKSNGCQICSKFAPSIMDCVHPRVTRFNSPCLRKQSEPHFRPDSPRFVYYSFAHLHTTITLILGLRRDINLCPIVALII